MDQELEGRWEAETDAGWAIAEASGNVVGRVNLREIHLDEGGAQVAYWVLPNARGREVAGDGTATACRWAFVDLGLHRIELAHSVLNAASCRVASKAGFAFEGTRRSALLHPDGWHDMHLHARLNLD